MCKIAGCVANSADPKQMPHLAEVHTPGNIFEVIIMTIAQNVCLDDF